MTPEGGGAPRRGSEKKIFGLPRNVVIAGGIAFVAAAVYVWYRNRNSAASSASTQGTTADTTGTDFSGEISTLQQEIQDLQGQLAGVGSSGAGASGGGGSSGGGSTGSGSTGTGDTGGGSSGSTSSGGSGDTGGTGGGTGSTGTGSTPSGTGGTPPAPAAKRPPPTPANVHAVHVTANEIGLVWNPSPGATGYRIRVTYQGKLAGSTSPTSPGGTVHGLTPDHTYTCHVAAVGPGGTSPETGGPIVKTPRA